MKKVVVLLFLLITSLHLFAQQNTEDKKARKAFDKEQQAVNWNFKYEDGKIYWQKVFTFPEADSLAVIEYFNNKKYFTQVGDQYYSNALLAEFNDLSTMHEPMIFQSTCNMYFYFQINKGRYRITVTDITWKTTTGTGGLFFMTQENNLSMQDFIDNINKYTEQPFRKGICKNTNICLLNLFNYKYKHKVIKSINEDF